MRLIFKLFSIIILLSISSSFASAQGTGVSGDWDLVMNTPGGQRNMRATFKVEGESITGELKRADGAGTALKGSLKSGTIQFAYTVKYQDNDLEITMTGKVDGDTMKGSVSFGGFAEDEWSGKRSAGTASSNGANGGGAKAVSIDVSGTWAVSVETGQGSGSPTLTLKQEGDRLTGQYQGMLGEAPLSGTLNGSQIEFSFKVSGQLEGTISYKGTTDGKSMQGKVSLAGIGEGTFNGKKK